MTISTDLTSRNNPIADCRQPIVPMPDSAGRQFGQSLAGVSVSPYRDVEQFLLEIRRPVERLPMEVIRAVRRMMVDPQAPCALILRGMPLDAALPPTPTKGETLTSKETHVSEGSLLGIAQLLGAPVGYHAEKNGALIHSVSPVFGSEREQSNQGSNTLFNLHTENGFTPLRPEMILLLCLRQDHDAVAGTLLAPIRDACARLDPADLLVLRQPRFEQKAPKSFQEGHGGIEIWSSPKPIITGPEELPEGNITVGGMRPLDQRAEQAYERLVDALHHPDVLQVARLQAGDLLIIDNRKAVHGRTPFQPRFDGEDRWLQRCFVRSMLWDGRSYPGASLRVF